MKEFCKIYNSEKFGQMLVMMDLDDKGQPAVFLKFIPAGMGVCDPIFSYSDDDKGTAWDKAEKAYKQMDKDLCESLCQRIIGELIG